MKKIHSFDAVHDGQQMYRKILKAYSNPLKAVDISELSQKLYGSNKEFLAVAFTLLDNKTSFYSFDNKILDENIISLTLAKPTDCSNADFIFVENKANLKPALKMAKSGTNIDPHKSATIIVKVDEQINTSITMLGPGIETSITMLVSPIVDEAIALRDSMFFEYPQGIDFIFTRNDGALFAIPRLVKKGVN